MKIKCGLVGLILILSGITGVKAQEVFIDSIYTCEEVDTIYKILENDIIPFNCIDDFEVTLVRNAENGIVTFFQNGPKVSDRVWARYQPRRDFFGIDSFRYRLCCTAGSGNCDEGWAYIFVCPVNDKPEAFDDYSTNLEDSIQYIKPALNDTDLENDRLRVNIIGGPKNGEVLVLNDNSTIQFIPDLHWFGSDTIQYIITDEPIGNDILFDTAFIYITVESINDAPIVENENVVILEEESECFDVLANDFDVEGQTIRYTITETAKNGVSFQRTEDNLICYTPAENYYGHDTVRYEVCDYLIPEEEIKCTEGILAIYVTDVNDKPVAINDEVEILEDDTIVIDVQANDYDVEEGLLYTVVLDGYPTSGGNIVIFDQDSLQYNAPPNWNGVDTLLYEICDNGLPRECDTAQVIVRILPVNDPPIAVNDYEIIGEDEEGVFEVQVNDSDPDNDGVLTTHVVENCKSEHGVAVEQVGNKIRYTPDEEFYGNDTVCYYICDPQNLCDSAFIFITVESINDAPVAVDDYVTMLEDFDTVVVVLENDSDVEESALTSRIIVGSTNGIDFVVDDQMVSYTPNEHYFGLDSITYEICDFDLDTKCDTAKIYFEVLPVNDPPNAQGEEVDVNEDEVTVLDVLANDSDIEDESLEVTIVQDPENGTVEIVNGKLEFTPDSNFVGSDTICYAVCDLDETDPLCDTACLVIEVNDVNDSPVANDDVTSTTEDTPIIIDVQLNDEDVENGVLTTRAISGSGIIEVLDNDSIRFVPDMDFNGSTTIVYEICDDGTPMFCDTASVLISVTAVNDAPVALNDDYLINEDEVVIMNVLANDTDVEDATEVWLFEIIDSARFGSVLINQEDIVYTPNENYNGVDTIRYRICDSDVPPLCDTALAIVEISPLNDKPTAVDDEAPVFPLYEDGDAFLVNLLENDFDVDGDSLFVRIIGGPLFGDIELLEDNETLFYQSLKDSFGTEVIIYEICDNGTPQACDTAVLSFVIFPIDDAPVAVDDEATTEINVPVTIDVTSNDYDVEGDAFEIVQATSSTPNALVEIVDGKLVYTPNEGYQGCEFISYTICSVEGDVPPCDEAEVWVCVAIDNEPPLARNDFSIIDEDQDVVVDVLVNDVDPDGDMLHIEIVEPVGIGTVDVVNGEINYSPQPNYFGIDSIYYEVCDSVEYVNKCDTALLVITVRSINDAPVAENDSTVTFEEEVVNIDVRLNDLDVEGDDLLVLSTEAVNGTVSIGADGSLFYRPNKDFCGRDTFTYVVCDNAINSGCDTADVYIDVECVVDPLVANDDFTNCLQDGNVQIDVESNDINVDSDGQVIQILDQPNNGSAFVMSNDNIFYTPLEGYSGFDTICYRACDSLNLVNCDTAYIYIQVVPVFDVLGVDDDFLEVQEDELGVINILENDSNRLGTGFEPNVISGPSNGDYILVDGVITYVPNENWWGYDTLHVEVCDTLDPHQQCDTSLVVILVVSVNDKPIAENDSLEVDQGEIGSVVVAENDSDVDAIILAYEVIEQPIGGSVVIDNDGILTYIPNDGFTGDDVLTYTICDEELACDTAVVFITVIDTALRRCLEDPANCNIPDNVVMSPNGDGINDLFVIDGLEALGGGELRVFNRWGDVVYYSEDYDNSWGGDYAEGSLQSGNLLPVGVYYYVLTILNTGEEYAGWVYIKI